MSAPIMRIRKILTTLLALAIGVSALAYSPPAQAQEIQLTGPLAGAPAVRKLRYYRKGRFMIGAGPSFTLLDEYRRTIFLSGRLQYNITDWLALGVWGGYGLIQTTTDLTDQIDQQAPRNSRTAINIAPNGPNVPGRTGSPTFADQTAKMQWVAAPELQFTPFRGKLAIFQKLFVDTDAFLHGGVAVIGLQERGDCGATGQKACSDASTFNVASRTAIAPTFGLGLNFYFSEFLSLGVDYRALPFSWNRAGFDSRGGGNNNKFPDQKVDSNDQTFKFNQMITVMLGFSFSPGSGVHPDVSE
jgi:outer membrane beta-barrel protein